MFLHHGVDDETVAMIPQVSHAWMAWQLGVRWGNRHIRRPELKAETLAAVMLHDCGWVEADAAPEVDEEGRPRTFDRMLPGTHLGVWRTSVARVAAHSRYAALLVSSHFAFLAGLKLRDLLDRDDTAAARLTQAFVAEMERVQEVWREQLRSDPRYRDFVTGPGWERNARFLALCDRVSVHLCAELAGEFDVVAPTREGTQDIRFTHLGSGRWKVQPWPLQGSALAIHCEARRLSARRFANAQELQQAVQQAPGVRLEFQLVRSSAASARG